MQLRAYMKNQKLSLADFAKLVGTSQASVSRWMTGARTPGPEFMRRIHKATDGHVAPLDFLYPEVAA